MQSKYNKPSLKLLELRKYARALLAAKKFEEAQAVANEIARQESLETKEAGAKMQREYSQAYENLIQKYDANKEEIMKTYDHKMDNIKNSEGIDLKPLETRLQTLQTTKKNMEESKIKSKSIHSSLTKGPIASRSPPISLTGKLKLPPLKAPQIKQSPILSKSCPKKPSSSLK